MKDALRQMAQQLRKAKVIMVGGMVMPADMQVRLVQMTEDFAEIMEKLDVNNNVALFDRLDYLLRIEKGLAV